MKLLPAFVLAQGCPVAARKDALGPAPAAS